MRPHSTADDRVATLTKRFRVLHCAVVEDADRVLAAPLEPLGARV